MRYNVRLNSIQTFAQYCVAPTVRRLMELCTECDCGTAQMAVSTNCRYSMLYASHGRLIEIVIQLHDSKWTAYVAGTVCSCINIKKVWVMKHLCICINHTIRMRKHNKSNWVASEIMFFLCPLLSQLWVHSRASGHTLHNLVEREKQRTVCESVDDFEFNYGQVNGARHTKDLCWYNVSKK